MAAPENRDVRQEKSALLIASRHSYERAGDGTAREDHIIACRCKSQGAPIRYRFKISAGRTRSKKAGHRAPHHFQRARFEFEVALE